MPPAIHQRRRARQACTHCNARRVKCNVTERSPCDNCVAADAKCELRVSRRGKHPRHRPSQASIHHPDLELNRQQQQQDQQHQHQQQQQQPPPPPPPHPDSSYSPAHTRSHSQPLVKPYSPYYPALKTPSYPQPPSLSQTRLPPITTPDSLHSGHHSTTCSVPETSPRDELSGATDTPPPPPNDEEMSQASIALASLSRGVHPESKPDAVPDDKPDSKEYSASIFFGESSSIRYFGTDNLASAVAQIDSLPSQTRASRWQADRDEASLASLKAIPQGPFSLPPRHVTTALLQTYFEWFHPFCPIVDEPDVWHQFETGTLSTILLQSILFVATGHCDDSVLRDGHLGDRTDAKCKFFNRARDLYHADVESQPLIVLQSLILMSLWRGPTPREKDARHWIGDAISMAQRRGLHRSRSQGKHAPDARVPMRQKKLARRVWWSIYLHERQVSASVGLPQRIRDEDCDIEPLERCDFEMAFCPTRTEAQIRIAIDYTIGITQLSVLLGKVVMHMYQPRATPTPPQRAALRGELLDWKQNLPSTMRIDEDIGRQPDLHTSMLDMAYNYIFMLLYRNCYSRNLVFDAEGLFAQQAAARTGRLIEDMLARGIIRHAQTHVITNIANALCVTGMELRSARGVARTVAESRTKVCLGGLQELEVTWEFRNWLLRIFFRNSASTPGGGDTRQGSRIGTPLVNFDAAAAGFMAAAPLGGGEFDGFGGAGGGYEDVTREMDPMQWPLDQVERLLFSQICDSNPFW